MLRYLAAIALLALVFVLCAALMGTIGGAVVTLFLTPVWMMPVYGAHNADLA